MNRGFEIAVRVLGLAVILCAIGWVCLRLLKRSDDPKQIIFKLLFSLVLVAGEVFIIRWLGKYLGGSTLANFGIALPMAGSIVACGITLSIVWTSQISALLFGPLTSLFDGGNDQLKPEPLYSIAEARRKQGKYLEAVIEIRKQLDRFPNDIKGVMLLAGIQAENLNDFPSAEITLNHFCDQPDALPQQVTAALNQLADWYLKLAQDADSARAALGKITTRFPDTELALLAAERIAHLDGAEKMLHGAHDRQPLALPEAEKNIGLLESSRHLAPRETDPAQLAATYVKHLEQHPLDAEIREQLAILYADHYQRLDLAANELAQLIEQPHQPVKRVVHWLNLLADLQIRHGADHDTVRGTLEKIGERFPETAAAAMARTRLNSLRREIKAHQETSSVKLGVYEQKLGLKYGPPSRL